MFKREFCKFNFCSKNDNSPKIKFYDLKELNKQLLVVTYEELLAIEMLSDDDQEQYKCIPIEVFRPHDQLVASFHAGLQKMLNDGITLIRITGESNNVKLNETDLSFIKDTSDKYKNYPLDTGYTENFSYIRKTLYKDVIQLDALESIYVIIFFPHLDKNNYFSYTLIFGLKKNNIELNNLKFNLLKDVKLTYLNANHFSQNYFYELFNFDNNPFLNEDYRLAGNNLIWPNNNIKNTNFEELKKLNIKKIRISIYIYSLNLYCYIGRSLDIIEYESKGWYVNYSIDHCDFCDTKWD